MYNFDNKHVVISGATSGIGLVMAENFLDAGAQVTVIARSKEKLDAMERCRGLRIDLIDAQAIMNVGKQLETPVDHLINNAAIAEFTDFPLCSLEQLQQHIAINLVAPFLLSQQLLPLFNEGASILNVSSYFSDRMLQGRPSSMYSLSKGGLYSLTKALAFELGKKGIRVNAIAPGSVNTPLFKANLEKMAVDEQAGFYQRIQNLYPLGCIGSSQDVANLALFMCSNQAAWMTGSIVNLDGGLTTH
ncbi:SDR family NAD(P)-dependent oxidoreductase [Agaribacterium haliotis]|uniref:SDR family NAD(P)-dependent oxidoreductase n=1 Tax=Agaribacterium haliotis TaxID=2013869 RepID=UPI0013045AA7|nr:SDR family oxidoreductase [Agaribacterium haliotis]